MRVCVCLSNLRYRERQVVLPRCLHHIEELRLASCTNCFSSLYNVWFERKSLWKVFASFAPNSRARTVTLRVTLGRMNLAQYLIFAYHFRRSHVEGQAQYITGTIVAIRDRWRTMYTCLNDERFEWKTLWKFFAGDALNAMHARYTSRLPMAGWILPTTWTQLEYSRSLHVEGHTL